MLAPVAVLSVLPVFVFVLVFGLDDLGDVCAPDVPQLQRPVVSRFLRLWLYGLVSPGRGLPFLCQSVRVASIRHQYLLSQSSVWVWQLPRCCVGHHRSRLWEWCVVGWRHSVGVIVVVGIRHRYPQLQNSVWVWQSSRCYDCVESPPVTYM